MVNWSFIVFLTQEQKALERKKEEEEREKKALQALSEREKVIISNTVTNFYSFMNLSLNGRVSLAGKISRSSSNHNFIGLIK